MDDALDVKLTPSRLAVVIVAALTFVPAGATSPAADADGNLSVSRFAFAGGSTTFLQVASADAVAQAVVTAPAGVTARLDAPAGARLGLISVGLSDVPGTTGTSANAPLVADDPARHAGTPRAEACAPGAHGAVWTAALSVLGQSFDLAIYVDAPAGGSVTLRYCPVWPSTTLPAGVTADSVLLIVDDVFAMPTAPGRYTWSGLVSPPRADLTPDLARTFEVRATEAVPHTLTLRSRYDAKRKVVALDGKLTAVGQPEAGVDVSFAASTSSFDDLTLFGPVKTNAAGEFSVTRRVEETTLFSASADLPDIPCSAPTTAPAGCVRETVSDPEGASTIVRVRSAADPKLVVRRSDQARARRSNVTLADFPAGWRPYDTFSVLGCRAFAPRLSDLVASGDVESRVFAAEDAVAASRAVVYATEDQARKAFARTARIGLARCLADEVRAEGATVLQLGPTSYPALGAETRAFRVVYALGDFVVNTDFVWFRQGRLVAQLGFLSATQPLVYADDVALKVAARARR